MGDIVKPLRQNSLSIPISSTWNINCKPMSCCTFESQTFASFNFDIPPLPCKFARTHPDALSFERGQKKRNNLIRTRGCLNKLKCSPTIGRFCTSKRPAPLYPILTQYNTPYLPGSTKPHRTQKTLSKPRASPLVSGQRSSLRSRANHQ